jgi:beta-mannosidase
MKTLESFALPEDMSIDSDVMHSHQKCLSGNEKIMSYVREYYKIPQNFAHFVYLSQIIQADAIRYGVEHFRRHRGRCMGALYWQLNDCWPVVSWASVDYFGRWKALHYRAKKFFTPTLISVHEDGDKKIINISNETLADFFGIVTATLKNNKFETIESFSCSVSLPELSAVDITLPESLYKKAEANKSEFFLEYKLESDGITIAQDSKIYVKPFEYKFESPEISASIKEDNGEYFLDITAKRYAKNVMLEWKNADVTPDDNFFDITNEKTSVKLIGTKEAIFSEMPQIISVYDIQQ